MDDLEPMTDAEKTMGVMMRSVWDNPTDRTNQLVCADAVVEAMGWEYEDALSHAEYHATRSLQFRDGF